MDLTRIYRSPGLFTPCLNCGHVSHARCHDAWFENDSTECPTGCGCNCFELANKGFKFDTAEAFHEEIDDDDLVMLGFDDDDDRSKAKKIPNHGRKSASGLGSYVKLGKR